MIGGAVAWHTHMTGLATHVGIDERKVVEMPWFLKHNTFPWPARAVVGYCFWTQIMFGTR